MLPKVHAVAVRFCMEEGGWTLLDSNKKNPISLKWKENWIFLLRNAYSVKIIEWVMVSRTSDPDKQYRKKISFNELCKKLGTNYKKEKPQQAKHKQKHVFLQEAGDEIKGLISPNQPKLLRYIQG